MENQTPTTPTRLDSRALKGRGLAALAAALILLVIVIFLIKAGQIPVWLLLITGVLAVYGLRTFWRLNK